MIKSMTGYGRSIHTDSDCSITVEIRSFNSRIFDMKIRGFTLDIETENNIKSELEKRLIRGNISLKIDFEHMSTLNKDFFDKEKFEMLMDTLKEIYVSYGQKINLSDILSFQDLIKTEVSTKVNLVSSHKQYFKQLIK